jgi:hypothetical protein
MKTTVSIVAIWILCISSIGMLFFNVANEGKVLGAGSLTESVFPAYPPEIDGIFSEGEWNDASSIELNHGYLLVQNDASNLYLMVDLIGDTHEDPPLTEAPWGDYFWLSFDVNIDGIITSQVDINYATYPGSHILGKSNYLGPNEWTTLTGTRSQLGAGFGPSINSQTSHRIWEFAISLSEIGAVPNGLVRIGLRTYSQEPSFTDDNPPGFSADFADLMEIALATAQIDLLVLSDEAFLDALKPLKEHKDYSGINTYVQSWQSLNNSFSGWDEPERIKKGLAAYETYCDIRYTMLVGDTDKFPVRYTMNDRYTPEAYNRSFYSADLYYADLYKPGKVFDDWDSNNNGYFGELRGESIGGDPLNYDDVDLNPDIAVGRIPASTSSEVTTYVNKVIDYEYSAYKSNWAKKALLTATTDWVSDACQSKEDIATNYLTEYDIQRLYQSGNPCVSTPELNATNINANINMGVGFVNYIGHGNRDGWAIPGGYTSTNLAGLTNTNMLPIAFASSCGTAGFSTEPPYHPYTDIYGSHHAGTEDGEVFSHVPEQPAAIQVVDNPNCFAEDFLLKYDTGGVGYIGCVTGAQPSSIDLDKLFFESLTYNWDTLGGMWNFMVQRYYTTHIFPEIIDPPDWTVLAAFHQPWKFHLFGDPSLRINGISRIQKVDFCGTYSMNHDGWKGTLELWGVPDAYIETMPNVEGVYRSSEGAEHAAYGYVRTWTYPIPSEWGPDHKIEFYIDFSDTPEGSDDQKFEGYLFTQTKEAMAGITWWSGTPFGFFAVKEDGAAVSIGNGAIDKQDFCGTYSMNHDGWKGTLTLWEEPDDYIEQLPNIEGIYKASDGAEHNVRGYVRTPTYSLPSEWGPDHKIEFYIDFPDTPQEDDDQEFEGYLFTQTREGMAGNTSWQQTPFGFFAKRFLLSIFNVTVEKTYQVTTLSNSNIENFNFTQTLKRISFNVTGPAESTGYCNTTIPSELLWGEFTIHMDGNPLVRDVDYSQTSNGTHNSFYVTYTHSTHLLEITATEVIPEFPAIMTLPLLILASLIALKLSKKTKKQ